MSTYMKMTLNPDTDKFELAVWHDDYYGKHHYGVEFPDGTIVDPREVELETRDNTPEDVEKITTELEEALGVIMNKTTPDRETIVPIETMIKAGKQAQKEQNKLLKKYDDAQLIAVLQNLQSSMKTASTMLKRCKHDEHAGELMGASDIVQTWIEGINDDTD